MSILPLVIKSHRGLVFSGRVLGALRAYSSSNETSQLGSVGQRIQSRLSEKFGSSNLQVINPSYPSESHFTGRSEPLIPLVLFYRIKVISKEFAEKGSSLCDTSFPDKCLCWLPWVTCHHSHSYSSSSSQSLVKRHQLIYKALSEDMASGAIHALQLETLTPEEAKGMPQ
ncbi:MAG: hypothetical protein DHS80DRAFT_25213 [Piptocephalis tieghemiana]|nr:MAG: hypothetical protein DHS80DRAFT_25213 [Piptocephalis tieghemiana]